MHTLDLLLGLYQIFFRSLDRLIESNISTFCNVLLKDRPAADRNPERLLLWLLIGWLIGLLLGLRLICWHRLGCLILIRWLVWIWDLLILGRGLVVIWGLLILGHRPGGVLRLRVLLRSLIILLGFVGRHASVFLVGWLALWLRLRLRLRLFRLERITTHHWLPSLETL